MKLKCWRNTFSIKKKKMFWRNKTQHISNDFFGESISNDLAHIQCLFLKQRIRYFFSYYYYYCCCCCCYYLWWQWYALSEIIFFKNKIKKKRKEGIIDRICLHQKKKNQRYIRMHVSSATVFLLRKRTEGIYFYHLK